MITLKILLGMAIVYLCYRAWPSYRSNPTGFINALTVNVIATTLSLIRFVFHITKGILVLLLGLVYAISPIDAIPDIILGLGQIDDFLFMASAFGYFSKQVVSFPAIDTRPRSKK
jgi:Protein of unknown function (DUF1232)